MAMANNYGLRTEHADREVILKQGYVRIKTNNVFSVSRKWKKKWAVLQDSVIPAKRCIQLFKNDKCMKKTQSFQDIFLENIKDIEIVNLSNNLNGLKITLKDDRSETLVFDSKTEIKEWYDHFQRLCFGESEQDGNTSNGESEKHQETEDHAVKSTENQMEEKRDCFEVSLQPSAKLHVSGPCSLQITPGYIELHDIQDPEMFLASWPISSMRRFGFDQNKFMFEAGRRCDTGEGIFIFKTKDGEQIHKIVQSYAEQLAVQTRKFSSTDNNDNDEFELRPLPPIPPE